MIKRFKIFEQRINPEEIEFKSNLRWFNEHPKVFNKQEELDMIKDLFEQRKILQDILDIPQITEMDPYGEENWTDIPDVMIAMKNPIAKMVRILEERLKLLRSFK
jgi:hypothetical protein